MDQISYPNAVCFLVVFADSESQSHPLSCYFISFHRKNLWKSLASISDHRVRMSVWNGENYKWEERKNGMDWEEKWAMFVSQPISLFPFPSPSTHLPGPQGSFSMARFSFFPKGAEWGKGKIKRIKGTERDNCPLDRMDRREEDQGGSGGRGEEGREKGKGWLFPPPSTHKLIIIDPNCPLWPFDVPIRALIPSMTMFNFTKKDSGVNRRASDIQDRSSTYRIADTPRLVMSGLADLMGGRRRSPSLPRNSLPNSSTSISSNKRKQSAPAAGARDLGMAFGPFVDVAMAHARAPTTSRHESQVRENG